LRSPIDLLLNILVLLPLLLFTLYVSWHVKSRQAAALAREAAESRRVAVPETIRRLPYP
jgi:hypothetical protein